jgi:hypothetical protein
MTENPIKDKDYYPYPTAIDVHDNNFERRHERATSKGRFGQIFRFKLRFGKNVPHIMYDGIVDPKTKDASGVVRPESRICIRNNKNQTVVNMDAENGFKNINRDEKLFDCEIKIEKK